MPSQIVIAGIRFRATSPSRYVTFNNRLEIAFQKSGAWRVTDLTKDTAREFESLDEARAWMTEITAQLRKELTR